MVGLITPFGSVRDEQQANDMLQFCDDIQVSDMFIHTGLQNISTGVIPDMAGYINQNRGNKDFWVYFDAFMLCRVSNKFIPEGIDEKHTYINYLDSYDRIFANPIFPEVRDHFIRRILALVDLLHPKGICIERAYFYPNQYGQGTNTEKSQALTDFLRELAGELHDRGVLLGVCIWADVETLQNAQEWESFVDYLFPQIYKEGKEFNRLYSKFANNSKYIPIIGAHNHKPAETKRQIKKVKDYIIFSYDQLEKTHTETEERWVNVDGRMVKYKRIHTKCSKSHLDQKRRFRGLE